jgi:Protein of unknown function (DUF3352)
MKKFIKIGFIGALTLLYTPEVEANTINRKPALVRQTQTLQSNQRTFVFKNTIAYLERKLSLAAANQTNENTPAPVTSSAEITDFFPEKTPVLVLFNTSSKGWGNLKRFHLFDMTHKWVSQLLPKDASTTFDYSRDVESWLGGEIAIGVLPKVANQTVTLESSLVIIAPIRDERRLDSLIDMVEKDKGKVKIRKYNDATIYEIDISSDTPEPVTAFKAKSKQPIPTPDELNLDTLVIASLNGHVALGYSTQAVERLVDTRIANAEINRQKPQFEEFIRRQRSNQALYSVYQNPYEYMLVFKDLIKDLSKSEELKDFKDVFQLPVFQPEYFEKYNGIYTSFAPQPEGLRIQVQTLFNPNKLKSAKLEDKITNRMPGTTYSTLTGSNINLQWQTLTKFLAASIPEFDKGLKQFRTFVKSTTGLDFDKEIIGWMDGEYGFFMYPTKGGLFNTFYPNFNLGVGLIIKTTNRSVAENTFNKLGKLLETSSSGIVTTQNAEIKGQAVTNWNISIDKPGSLLAYGWVDKDTLMVTSGFGAMTDLVPKPKAPLTSAYNFSNAIAPLPYPNQGYFYVNTGSFLSWAYGFVPKEYHSNEYFKIFKQAAGSVHSLSATTSKIEQGENPGEQFDFLMTLAPTRKPVSN